jgi:hypothetical protein
MRGSGAQLTGGTATAAAESSRTQPVCVTAWVQADTVWPLVTGCEVVRGEFAV